MKEKNSQRTTRFTRRKHPLILPICSSRANPVLRRFSWLQWDLGSQQPVMTAGPVATPVVPTPASPDPHPAGHHSWQIAVAVAVLLLFALIIIGISWLQWRTPRTEDQVLCQLEAALILCAGPFQTDTSLLLYLKVDRQATPRRCCQSAERSVAVIQPDGCHGVARVAGDIQMV